MSLLFLILSTKFVDSVWFWSAFKFLSFSKEVGLAFYSCLGSTAHAYDYTEIFLV